MTRYTLNQKNIKAIYDLALASEIHDGITWYQRAEYDIISLAKAYDLTQRQVSAIVAVTSPNLAWSQNLRVAELLINGYRDCIEPDLVACSAYKKNRAKAYRILDGESPDDVVSGPKVTAFYHNLMGDDSHVTVDGHAFNIWRAEHKTLQESEVSKKLMPVIANDYRVVAADLGLKGHELQAITWVVWRRLNGITA